MSVHTTTVTVVTNGAGDFTGYTPRPVNGELDTIHIDLGTITPGATWTLTADEDGATPLLTATPAVSTDCSPRASAVGITNVAITNSFVPIPLTGRAKVVVSGGGASNIGTVSVTWDDGR